MSASLIFISDIDECKNKKIRVNCKSQGGRCKNTDGSYECNCPRGFEMNAVCEGNSGWVKNRNLDPRRENLGSRPGEPCILSPGVLYIPLAGGVPLGH